MRKITSLFLCILMLAALAVPAAAETAAPAFVLTADKTEVLPGDTVTITVSVAEGNTAECSNFGVIVKYDKNVFQFVEVDSDANKGGMQRSILADPSGDINTNIFAASNNGDPYPGVGAWNTNPVEGTDPSQTATVPSGKVGKVVLKSMENVAVDTTSAITGIASVDGGKATAEVTPVEVKFVDGLWGDADGNKRVNSNDVTVVMEYCVKKRDADEFNLALSDVDGNGRVNSNDVTLIMEYCVHKISQFPVETK